MNKCHFFRNYTNNTPPMPLRLLFILPMVLTCLIHTSEISAQDKISVCREGFHRMEGKWAGEINVVSPTQPADTLALSVENCLLKETLLQIVRHEGKLKNDSIRIALAPDSKNVFIDQNAWLLSLAVYDGDAIIIVLEQKGKENGKECQLRIRYTISDDRYSVKKDIRHFGEKDFSLREWATLTKQE